MPQLSPTPSSDQNSVLKRQRLETKQPTSEKFLQHFPGHRIQYFDDTKKSKTAALDIDQFDPTQAKKKQASGCGVYFCPNACKDKRRIANLECIQALFGDIDCAKEGENISVEEMESRKDGVLQKLLACEMYPHVVIETKNGLQAIWLLKPQKPQESIDMFREAEELIILYFNADPGAKDPTRVLRMPGFLHQKDPHHPFLCQLVLNELSRKAFDLSEALAMLQTLTGTKKKISIKHPKTAGSIEKGVRVGGRNVAAAAMTGKIISKLDNDEWETKGWQKLCMWNEKNEEPLSEEELRQVFESIAKKRLRDGNEKHESKAQAVWIIELVEDAQHELFRDQFKRAYVAVQTESSRHVYLVESRAYKDFLASKLYVEQKKAAHPQALDSAISVLAAQAKYDGKEIELYNRVAETKSVLWYDLSDDSGRAVMITEKGYSVIEQPPILFRPYAHQKAQVLPSTPKEADASLLLKYVNLREPEKRLLLVWIVACFIPDIPHPVLNFFGPQGSSKSVLAEMIKRIVDPSQMETSSLPLTENDLIQHLDHHWLSCFDNLQKLKNEYSDALCRATTGSGHSKRELFKNDDDFIYSFRRCMILNGINLVATKPDLLDRSITFQFQRISERQRKTLKTIKQEFDDDLPRILGGIFQALSKVLGAKNEPLSELPRMADFALVACAIAESLGIPRAEFLDSYNGNIAQQHEQALHEDAVGIVVWEVMKKKPIIKGTPTEVYTELTKAADKAEVEAWPRSPQTLTRRLNELETNFREIGIRINHGKTDGERWTIIEWKEEE